MLSRRLLRIKVLQALYAYWQQEGANKGALEKNLLKSINELEGVYLSALHLPVKLTEYIEVDLNPEETKYLPKASDFKAIQIFTNNSVIKLLRESENFQIRTQNLKVSWELEKDYLFRLFKAFKEKDEFQVYMLKTSPTFKEQKAFFKIIIDYLFEDEDFNQIFEDAFLEWDDDKEPVNRSILRTLDELKETSTEFKLAELSPDIKEDKEFATELFKQTIVNNDTVTDLIVEFTPNWDKDRIALMDMILLKMAITEMMHFPYIPVKVTINEYLEIAKRYSTPNSNKFLNGILDKIYHKLNDEGKILKQGRGLIQ